MLNTSFLNEKTKSNVRKALQSIPSGLVRPDEVKNIVLDSGYSHKVTGFEDYFEENSLEPLQCPVTMTGIYEVLIETHQSIAKYELINRKGELSVLLYKSLYIPKLK